jgi:hypothetical protein
MTSKLLIASFMYMQDAPLFWASVGFTVAIAMFVGAMVYNGNIAQARKGIVSVASYGLMLFWMTISRVTQTYFDTNGFSHSSRPEFAFAGTITIVVVSLAWLLGMVLGVFTFTSRDKFIKKIH